MKKNVKRKVCDRCPIGRELLATRTVTFSLDGTVWKIDLCEKHGNDLDRDLGGWGRLGREVEATAPTSMFGPQYIAESKRVAELRSKQVAEDRAVEAAWAESPIEPFVDAQDVEAPLRQSRPTDGRPWVFTNHARDRLEQRSVDIVDALHAATHPDIVRPGHQLGREIHERGGLKVVVDPMTRTILTVAIATDSDTDN